jgi:dTDP-4-amino-4,6-dideoxygalactose transaminase
LPVTEKLSKEIITLPIFPDMTKKQVLYIIKTINKFAKKIKL